MTELIATPQDVVHAYRLLLGREADPAGLAAYSALVTSREVGAGELAKMFWLSQEFKSSVGYLVPVGRDAGPPNDAAPLACVACTQRQVESATFRYWAERMRTRPGLLHRKNWEWCFITQALSERGMLRPGRRGVGFAVGNEPLTSLFAGTGCTILATDLDTQQAGERGWVAGGQHAAAAGELNALRLCSPELFAANVQFREVDMRHVPDDVAGYDFLWSSCAMEHLGSLAHGMDFVVDAMKCLRPGGIAVHTTELNVESDSRTIETGHSVVYRKRDLLALRAALAANGHAVEPFDFDFGDSEADRHVDEPPYGGKPHLKLRIEGFASTSFGLIVRKGER
ncbi:MAG TPA: hypothetical protein VFV97_01065 [Rhodanobacteraceae bacterium]|nr:hypothetical protein [Rhodanobacteraceae bacterium]